LKMNRLFLLLIIAAIPFAQQKRDVIAVADIDNNGLTDFEVKQVYDRLETELVNLGTYDVTNRSEVKKILKEQRFQQAGCTDQQCAAEIGKMLNADLMLISTILFDRGKGQMSATFKLVDVETARITTATTKDIKTKSISKLNENIDDMLRDLYQKSTGGITLVRRLSVDETLYEIVFNLNIDGVNCSYNQFASITSTGKTSIFKLAGGEYTFYFQKNQYKPYTKVIAVNSDQSFSINLEEDKSQIVEYRPPGIISIETEPSGCEIIINGQKIGSSPYSGILSSGEHQLELRKELYYTAVLSFSLGAGETKNIRQDLDPKFGYLNISSSPNEVSITIDGKKFGETPLSQLKLMSGRHEVKAEKDLYHPYSATYDIDDGEEKSIEVTLKEAFGKMLITTSPEKGAEVFVDGQKRGVTPFIFDPCPSGKYLIEVKKQFYNPVTEQVIVTDGSDVKRTLILSPNVGTLVVKAPNASIFLDGKKVGSGSFERKLPPGRYVVKAEQPKHYPVTKDVIITVGVTNEVELSLSPIQGSISVFVKPTEAQNGEIFVNGKSNGRAPKVLTMPVGSYSVEVKTDGFLNQEKDIVVEENANTTVNFTLMSYGGSIQQEIDKWKKRGKYSMRAAVLSAVLYGYFSYAAGQAYDNYNSAGTTNDALGFKDAVKANDISANISKGVVSTAVLYWSWCKLHQALVKQETPRDK